MKTKKILAILFAAMMVLSILPMSLFAAPTPVTPASTASITVEDALENDEFSAYKVINITYNAADNTLAYAWNADFAEYFADKGTDGAALTVEEFAELEDDADALKDLLSQLPNYIAAKGIAAVKTETAAADGKVTFAGLAMGEYFIRPTSTTSVYQLMFQKIEPTVQNVGGTQTYVIDDVTFTAKKTEVTVDKEADKTSVTKNEKVTYTITVDIPTYADNATDKSFYVADLLPDGLTIDTDSITVKIDGTAVDAAAYDLDTTATAAYTFKLSVRTAQYAASWSANGAKQLVITYTATLNDDDTTEVNTAETNTVTFDYSFYPYVENTHNQKTDSVDVTTFAIKIDKFVDGNEASKLADAKFDLYRVATQEEIDAGLSVTIPHTRIDGILLEANKVTGADGYVVFEKYEANGDRYDYYLVETAAPSGYNLLTEAKKVNFTDGDVAATDGVYTVKVPNKSGITLPTTGGMGTVIFTVIGIVLMGAAVILLVVSRKKSKANENK